MGTVGRLWFDDVPAWPASSGSAPAAELAAHLSRARVPDTTTTVVQTLPSPAAASIEQPTHPPQARPAPEPDALDADDFFTEAERDIRANRRDPEQRHRPVWRRRPVLAGAAGAAVLAAVGTTLALVVGAGGGASDRVATAESAVTSMSMASSSTDSPNCPAGTDGAVTTGRDAGDQQSGPGAIKAFNYGYYVLRSAKAARAVAEPDAVAGEVPMQYYIDQRPAGTTHCLRIVDRGNGTYAVELTEYRPDEDPLVIRQVIATTTRGGQTWITGIESVE